jgi:hypothetical protein
MKLKVKYNEDTGTILVEKLSIGHGFPPGQAAVEVRPGETYGSHPYRRLKRWCGEAGECEREVEGPEMKGLK